MTRYPVGSRCPGEVRDSLHIREVVRITGLRREQLICGSVATAFLVPHAMDSVIASTHRIRSLDSKSSSNCCRKAGAPVRSCRLPNRPCSRCSVLRSRIRRRCPMKSRPPSSCSDEHRVGELQNHLSKLLVGQGLRKFLEQTLIPLNEAVHEHVVRGDMQNFQELRFADLAQRLLRDVTRLVRPTRDARQILVATPPNDPNQLGLAILELLLFTEGVNCLTLGSGVPAQEVAGAARSYKVCPGGSAVRSRHFREDCRPGDPVVAHCAAGRFAAGRQWSRGQPARQADRQCAYRRGFQFGDGDDARTWRRGIDSAGVAATRLMPLTPR